MLGKQPAASDVGSEAGLDQDFKTAIVNMFRDLREIVARELKKL